MLSSPSFQATRRSLVFQSQPTHPAFVPSPSPRPSFPASASLLQFPCWSFLSPRQDETQKTLNRPTCKLLNACPRQASRSLRRGRRSVSCSRKKARFAQTDVKTARLLRGFCRLIKKVVASPSLSRSPIPASVPSCARLLPPPLSPLVTCSSRHVLRPDLVPFSLLSLPHFPRPRIRRRRVRVISNL